MSGEMRWFPRVAAVLAGTVLGIAACRHASVSDQPSPSATVNAAGAAPKCQVKIAARALEGCRAPNEPGCETCYVSNPNETCSKRWHNRLEMCVIDTTV